VLHVIPFVGATADRARYSSEDGQVGVQAASLDELDLPNVAGELEWVDANWRLDSGFDVGCDAGGWSYALEWFFLSRGHADERDLSNADNCFVRRRRWLRRLRRLTPDECAAVEAARVQEALALAAAARHEEALAAEAAEALRREEAVANRSALALDTWLERQMASKEMKPRKDTKSSTIAGPHSKRKGHRERNQGDVGASDNAAADAAPMEVEVRLRPSSMHETKLSVKLRYHSTAETVYLHQWLRSGAPGADTGGGGSASQEGVLQRGLQEFQKRHPRAPWVPSLGALLVQVNDAPLNGMSFQEIVDTIKFTSAAENGGLRRVRLRQPPPSNAASSPLETAAQLAAEVAADSSRPPRRIHGSSTAAAGGTLLEDKPLSTPPYTSRVKVVEVKSEAEAARRAERKAKKRAEKEAALARAGAESIQPAAAAAATSRNGASSPSGVEPASPPLVAAAEKEEEDPVQAQARADARAAAKRALDAAAREREVAALVALVADAEANDDATDEVVADRLGGRDGGGGLAGDTTDVFDDQLILDEEDFCNANFREMGAPAAGAGAATATQYPLPPVSNGKKSGFSLTGWVKSRATAKVSLGGAPGGATTAGAAELLPPNVRASSSSSWISDGDGGIVRGEDDDDEFDDDDDGFSAAETAAALAASDAALGLSLQDAKFKEVPSRNAHLSATTSELNESMAASNSISHHNSSSGSSVSRSIEVRLSDSGNAATDALSPATSPPRSFSAHASRGFASLAQSVLAPFGNTNDGEKGESSGDNLNQSKPYQSSKKGSNSGKSSSSTANVLELLSNFEAASSSEEEDNNNNNADKMSSTTASAVSAQYEDTREPFTTSTQAERRSISSGSSLFGGLTSTISMMGLTIGGATTSQDKSPRPVSPLPSKNSVLHLSEGASLAERPSTPPLPDDSTDNNEVDVIRNGQTGRDGRRRPQSPQSPVLHARGGSKAIKRGGLKKLTGSSLATSDRVGSAQVSSAASVMLSKHAPLVRGRRAGLAESSRVRFNEDYNMVREIERRPDQRGDEATSDDDEKEEEDEEDEEDEIEMSGDDDGEEGEDRDHKDGRLDREDSVGGSSDESEDDEFPESNAGRSDSDGDDDNGEEEAESEEEDNDEESEEELTEGSVLSTTAAYGGKDDPQSLSTRHPLSGVTSVAAARPKGVGAVARHRRGPPTNNTAAVSASSSASAPSSTDAGKAEKGGNRHSKSKSKAGGFTAGVSSMFV